MKFHISIIISMFTLIKAKVLAEYGSTAAYRPHPCCADWNETRNSIEHWQKLLFVQRHKYVGTYCIRKKKPTDGTEYGQPYGWFGFPLNFQCTWIIIFNEIKGGGGRDNFTSKRNDPLINQHNKMRLQIWMANCDLQIILDQNRLFSIWFNMNQSLIIIQSLLQNQTGNDW